ncbi:MAG TPA: hypothetical protein VFL04_08645, partial [Rectinemataceae bacterium]|nr:hypothetical protein [Rectinemataceae bacterium]
MSRLSPIPLISALLILLARPLSAQAVSGTNAAPAPPGQTGSVAQPARTWMLGLCRLSVGELPADFRLLAASLPQLIAAELQVLPPRLASPEEFLESSDLAAERARYEAGGEFAKQLDLRAAKFLDPSIPRARREAEISAADRNLALASKHYGEALEKAGQNPEPQPDSGLPAHLSGANAKGELIDPPAVSPAVSAKAKALDFLVFGRVSIESDYAAVELSGYDASLDRTVFTWKGF